MGQKVHPIGFRLGITRNWDAKWYAERKNYTSLLQQDLKLHKFIETKSREGAIARVEIERTGNEINVTIYAARPGILIGRGGQSVEALRARLEKDSGERVRLTIKEAGIPQLQACLVAQNLAGRIESGVPYRRVMRQTASRTLEAGAKGIKIRCSGRLGGAEIARTEAIHQGRMPLHTLRADIDYGFVEAHTIMGRIGIKVWIYKGDILPERSQQSVTAEASEVSQGS
ncbi:MAG: 30S ribosomal protein S3 [Chloroflexota bacterium]|nr:30S ribosomal protein S3 [Chloroflexota bacterium]